MASRVLAHSLAQQWLLLLLSEALSPATSSAVAVAALPKPVLRTVLAVPAPGDTPWLPQIHYSHPEWPAPPWQVDWLNVHGISLKRKSQLQKRAKGEIPKPGTGGSSLKLHSSQGKFQADSLMLTYLKLHAETCWKLDNSPCLV